MHDWVSGHLELSPPKMLDQSKNVTGRTFHICPGIVHEHIFWPNVAKKAKRLLTLKVNDYFGKYFTVQARDNRVKRAASPHKAYAHDIISR